MPNNEPTVEEILWDTMDELITNIERNVGGLKVLTQHKTIAKIFEIREAALTVMEELESYQS